MFYVSKEWTGKHFKSTSKVKQRHTQKDITRSYSYKVVTYRLARVKYKPPTITVKLDVHPVETVKSFCLCKEQNHCEICLKQRVTESARLVCRLGTAIRISPRNTLRRIRIVPQWRLWTELGTLKFLPLPSPALLNNLYSLHFFFIALVFLLFLLLDWVARLLNLVIY